MAHELSRLAINVLKYISNGAKHRRQVGDINKLFGDDTSSFQLQVLCDENLIEVFAYDDPPPSDSMVFFINGAPREFVVTAKGMSFLRNEQYSNDEAKWMAAREAKAAKVRWIQWAVPIAISLVALILSILTRIGK